MHSENPNLKQLIALVATPVAKGLSALSNGENTYPVSAIEKYALDVFMRVHEIDNSFKSMNITLEYLKKKTYTNSKHAFSEHHTLHFENFLLRLTSVIDRCSLLAGSTMFMGNSTIERLGGKRKIDDQLKNFSPLSYGILNRMRDTINNERESRNKIAHQSGHSSKNLCALQAIEDSSADSILVKEITELMSYDEIKDQVIQDSVIRFQILYSTLDSLVTELINSFSFVYDELFKKA